jgi:hypothetical protein
MYFDPPIYPPIAPAAGHRYRVLRSPDSPRFGGLGWFIDTRIGKNTTPAGHEILTDLAVRGLISGADLRDLIDGVRLPDLADPNNHIKLGEEKRHFLRSIKQIVFYAWWPAIQHLKILHQQMMAATNRSHEFKLLGEALHLIQDSFGPAHVERDASTGDILNIHAYDAKAAPGDHALFIDARDNIFAPGKALSNAASKAIVASKEFLQMALKHLRLKTLPFATPPAVSVQTRADLNAFISRRLWLRLPDVHTGAQGWPVNALQGELNTWLALNAPHLPALQGNTFDSDAQNALQAFQQANGLKTTGSMDQSTWKKLLLP